MCVAGCSRETPAIRIGGREVSRPELAEILRPYAGDSAAVTATVENIIAMELVLRDAAERGIDSRTEIVEQLYDRRRERLQGVYLRYKLGLILVPEDSVVSFYEATGTMAGF